MACITPCPTGFARKKRKMIKTPAIADAHIRVCSEERLAGSVCETSVTSLVLEEVHEEDDPSYVFLSDDIDRIARRGAIRGEYFCYLAVHPNSDRKKNTFLGVSKDPLLDLYRHNHADAFDVPRPGGRGAVRPSAVARNTKTTHAAAPYWSMASVVGPFASKAHAQTATVAWSDHTRGDPSKNRKARVVASLFDIDYYGRDVPVDATFIAAHLTHTLGQSTAQLFQAMRDQVNGMDSPSGVFPGLAALTSLHTPLLSTTGHGPISFVRPVH